MGGGVTQSLGIGEAPHAAAGLPPAITPRELAEAVVRAAMATGELSVLSYRDEQALKGHVALRARWVALMALTAIHPQLPVSRISRPLGCGPNPLAAMAYVRRTVWWDEAMVIRLVVDLEGAADRRPMTGLEGLTRTVAQLLDGIMDTRGDWA